MKKSKRSDGLVYSTDPGFKAEEDHLQGETLAPGKQKLRLRLDTRHRAGKAVTLVQGFEGKAEDLEGLGKKLKSYCGSGGAVKEGEVIIQGDHRDKLLRWLLENGYTHTKKS